MSALANDNNNDDKWGVAGPTDDNIPPQIARLSSPGYKTFLEDNEALLFNSRTIPSLDDPVFTDVSYILLKLFTIIIDYEIIDHRTWTRKSNKFRYN
jgi:hypothetical protein